MTVAREAHGTNQNNGHHRVLQINGATQALIINDIQHNDIHQLKVYVLFMPLAHTQKPQITETIRAQCQEYATTKGQRIMSVFV